MIAKFLATYSKTTHSIAGAFTVLAGVYTASDKVRSLFDGLFKGHERLAAIFGIAVVIAVTYKGSHSDKGILVQASKIETKT